MPAVLKIIDSSEELLRSQLKKLKGMIMTIRKVRNRLKRGTVMIMANSILTSGLIQSGQFSRSKIFVMV